MPLIQMGDLPWQLDNSSIRLADTVSDLAAARNQWNNVPGPDVTLGVIARQSTIVDPSPTFNFACDTSIPEGRIVIVASNELGDGTFADALACTHRDPRTGDTTIRKAVIRLNVNVNWHNGSSRPNSNQLDFRSIITHEIGHALGAVHFDADGDFCTRGLSRNATMCEVGRAGSGLVSIVGQTWPRSLGFADKRGYTRAYCTFQQMNAGVDPC